MNNDILKLGPMASECAPAILIRLLEVMRDAVIVFDSEGRILLANSSAASLLDTCGLISSYRIQDLFHPCDIRTIRHNCEISEVPTSEEVRCQAVPNLPFTLDGRLNVCSCGMPGCPARICAVRVDSISSDRQAYVLVGREASRQSCDVMASDSEIKHLRHVRDRLSGTLKVILDTLDADDVDQLFKKSLLDIQEGLGADGAMLYLAENNGFRFQDGTIDLQKNRYPKFLVHGKSFESIVMSTRTATRFQVTQFDLNRLQHKDVDYRQVIDEDAGKTHFMPRYLLPPFYSFFAVPVWFAGQAIALIVVGWQYHHRLQREDARLMDTVAMYLSTQIMGAVKTLNAERLERFNQLTYEAKSRLFSLEDVSFLDVEREFEILGREFDAQFIPIFNKVDGDGDYQVVFDNGIRAPFTFFTTHPRKVTGEPGALTPMITRLITAPLVQDWLESFGQSRLGVIVDMRGMFEDYCGFLFLKNSSTQPFGDAELLLFSRILDTVEESILGREREGQERMISQALQLGMRSELNQVVGLSANGVYSSATEDAFVGGDFYQLVQTSSTSSCVIMGDVSGKGVEAASMSAAVRTALTAYAWGGVTPAQMVRTLNKFLLGFSRLETFATLFVGVIDQTTNRLTYCSAGHPPALLFRNNARAMEPLDVQSGVVGAFDDMAYVDGTVQLEQGDILLLYTDGVTEARDRKGAFFGERRLREVAFDLCSGDFDSLSQRLLKIIDTYTGRNLSDDIAVVALRYDGK